jgi:hypothetical protein
MKGWVEEKNGVSAIGHGEGAVLVGNTSNTMGWGEGWGAEKMLVEEVSSTSQHMLCCGYFVAMLCPFCHFLPVSIVFSCFFYDKLCSQLKK